VDWLPDLWRGRVGLTFAPGKTQADAATGVWERDLDADLMRLSKTYEIAVLVSLIEDHELIELQIPTLVERAQAHGIMVSRFPIRDGDLPRDMPRFHDLVRFVVNEAVAGRHVAIHCKGGLGRAGTVGGCVLRASGLDSDDALRELASTRSPNCPETGKQREFVRTFALI
jgi:protein-tyrosine phosphatase